MPSAEARPTARETSPEDPANDLDKLLAIRFRAAVRSGPDRRRRAARALLGLGQAPQPAGRQRRLAVEEILPLDGKRRLLLIRRDGVEHLVLLDQSSEIVVERGISRDGGFEAALREQAGATPRPEQRR